MRNAPEYLPETGTQSTVDAMELPALVADLKAALTEAGWIEGDRGLWTPPGQTDYRPLGACGIVITKDARCPKCGAKPYACGHGTEDFEDEIS